VWKSDALVSFVFALIKKIHCRNFRTHLIYTYIIYNGATNVLRIIIASLIFSRLQSNPVGRGVIKLKNFIEVEQY
jgi:hypothetical protein